MVKISNRLMTAAALVTQGYTLADVGTDHGYIPIYLLQQEKIPAAIAMDFVSSFDIFFKNQHSLICFTKNSAPPLRGAKHFYIIIVKQRNASVVHIQSP